MISVKECGVEMFGANSRVRIDEGAEILEGVEVNILASSESFRRFHQWYSVESIVLQ